MRAVFPVFLLLVAAACSVAAPPPKAATSVPDGAPMTFVPAGKFTMGGDPADALARCREANLSCLAEWFTREEPIHQVDLHAFWVDKTEVTNGMYAKCVQDGKCDPPTSAKSYARAAYYGSPQFEDFPVVFVTWQDADAYCSWADRRLPTEAEWEKAARGTDARVYPWGNDRPSTDLLNYKHAFEDTTAVGRFPKGASPYGALDMAGNVWEWTADWFGETYYAVSPGSNPPGPESGTMRVMRGGAFGAQVHNVRSAYRLPSDPAETYAWVGFRCARDK